jgi:hypothetical protein
MVTEALSSSCPPEEEAAEAAPQSAPPKAQERLVRRLPQTLAPGYQIGSPGDGRALRMELVMGGRRTTRSAKDSRCSFCRAELGESLELTIPGSGKHGQHASIGCFCSTRCRNCVLALAALHPSPLASDAFISQRALLSDRLLDLWRDGQGPDPGLVLKAAQRAGCGLPAAASAMSVQAGPWLLSEPA